jgi:hypothetical protein
VSKDTENISIWEYFQTYRKIYEVKYHCIRYYLNDSMDNSVLNGSGDGTFVLLARMTKSSLFLKQKRKKYRNSPSPAYESSRVGENVRQSFSILVDRDLTQPVSILPEKEKPKTYNCFPMSRLCFATDSRLQNVASKAPSVLCTFMSFCYILPFKC